MGAELEDTTRVTAQPEAGVLEVILDSWRRNNAILCHLLEVLPEGGLEATALPGSPSIAALYAHIHDVRLFFVSQAAPGFLPAVPESRAAEQARQPERDRGRIAEKLAESASAVQRLVKDRTARKVALQSKTVMYDHPLLLLQHLLWHEGYHVGQMKLALKGIGFVMHDALEMEVIWNHWRQEVWEAP